MLAKIVNLDPSPSEDDTALTRGLTAEIERRGLFPSISHALGVGLSELFEKLNEKKIKLPISRAVILDTMKRRDAWELGVILKVVQLAEGDRPIYVELTQGFMNTETPDNSRNAGDNILRGLTILAALGEEAKIAQFMREVVEKDPLGSEEYIRTVWNRAPTKSEWAGIAISFIKKTITGSDGEYVKNRICASQDENERNVAALKEACSLMKKAGMNDAGIWRIVARGYFRQFGLGNAKKDESRGPFFDEDNLDNIFYALEKSNLPEEVQKKMKRQLAYRLIKRGVWIEKALTLLQEMNEFNPAIARQMAHNMHQGDLRKKANRIGNILALLTFSPDGTIPPENIQLIKKIGDDTFDQSGSEFGRTQYVLSNIYHDAAVAAYAAVLKHDKNDNGGYQKIVNRLWRQLDRDTMPNGPSYNNTIVEHILDLCCRAGITFDDPAMYRWIIDLEMSKLGPDLAKLTAAFNGLTAIAQRYN